MRLTDEPIPGIDVEELLRYHAELKRRLEVIRQVLSVFAPPRLLRAPVAEGGREMPLRLQQIVQALEDAGRPLWAREICDALRAVDPTIQWRNPANSVYQAVVRSELGRQHVRQTGDGRWRLVADLTRREHDPADGPEHTAAGGGGAEPEAAEPAGARVMGAAAAAGGVLPGVGGVAPG